MNLGGSIKINKCGVLILTLILFLIFYYLTFARKVQTAGNYGILKNTNEINLRKLLIGSIQAAQSGGQEVQMVSKLIDINVKKKGKTLEGAAELITDADRRSHCAMIQGLQRLFPKLKIISEEDSSHLKCPEDNGHLFDLDPTVLADSAAVPDEIVSIDDVTVWIDPLDATQEFSEKLFEYVTTMVCVAVKGQPKIGVIHNPFSHKTTWAWQDVSYSADLSKIRRDDNTGGAGNAGNGIVKNPIFIVSRSHSGDVKQKAQQVFGDNINVIPAGGAGYKVLQVVFNNASAYIHTTQIKKWDICAGNAILNAMGGKMTNLLNEEINYSSEQEAVNKNGLLATLVNHKYFITKLLSTNINISNNNNKNKI